MTLTGREAIIEFLTGKNDVPIEAAQRRIFGSRPADEHGREFPIQ